MTSPVIAMEPDDLLPERIFSHKANVVLVMGATGVGKSYFVNSVHGSQKTSEGNLLAPCTTDCVAVPTEIGGTRMILIDTPGFDDPESTDSQILHKISTLLSALNYIEANLKGLIYLHRITDIRYPRSAVKTLSIFKHICGDGALNNVVLATTRWDGVEESLGAQRERQLRERYWSYVLGQGAQMTRYQGTGDSAKGIIGDLIGKASVVLDLQRELHSGKPLKQTGAGKIVSEDLENLKEEHEKALEELTRLREASTGKVKDRKAKEIQKDLDRQLAKLDQAREDEERLNQPIAENVRKQIEGEVLAKRPHKGISQIIAKFVNVLSLFLGLDSSAKDNIRDWLSDISDNSSDTL